jgi:hypothetical protein
MSADPYKPLFRRAAGANVPRLNTELLCGKGVGLHPRSRERFPLRQIVRRRTELKPTIYERSRAVLDIRPHEHLAVAVHHPAICVSVNCFLGPCQTHPHHKPRTRPVGNLASLKESHPNQSLFVFGDSFMRSLPLCGCRGWNALSQTAVTKGTNLVPQPLPLEHFHSRVSVLPLMPLHRPLFRLRKPDCQNADHDDRNARNDDPFPHAGSLIQNPKSKIQNPSIPFAPPRLRAFAFQTPLP